MKHEGDLAGVPAPGPKRPDQQVAKLLGALLLKLPLRLQEAAKRHYRSRDPEALEAAGAELREICAIESRARVFQGYGFGMVQPRCHCILCGEEQEAQREIIEHLDPASGSGCRVMRALIQHGEDALRAANAAAEARDARAATEAARRATVYRIDLALPPAPRESYAWNARSGGNLVWAEARLRALGFAEGRCDLGHGVTELRWERRTPNAYILADPFPKTGIPIRAWPIWAPGRIQPAPQVQPGHRGSAVEVLPDNAVHDLEAKLMMRVEKLLTVFARR